MPKALTQEEYLIQAKSIHGSKYSYDKTLYTRAHGAVTITCHEHGDFTLKATSHTVQKQGCAKCSGNVPYTTEEYIKKVSKVFENFYSYDKTIYTTAHSKIIVTCPNHGDFSQQAYVHLQGHGCPTCGNELVAKKLASNESMFSYTAWEKAGNISALFDGFKVYLIKCFNDKETFYKIGRTFTTLHKRFPSSMLPYEWVIIDTIEGTAHYIATLETELHRQLKAHHYTPAKEFNGKNECYTYTKDTLLEFKYRTERYINTC